MYRCLRVAVYGDYFFRAHNAAQMLHSAGDPEGKVYSRPDGNSRLTDLMLIACKAGRDGGAGSAH